MIKLDIPPQKIRKFLFNQGITDISTLQIRGMQINCPPNKINSESYDLIQYIIENNGFYEIYEIPQNGSKQSFAVLTITPQELIDLKSFCDVILIDGTQVNLILKGEVVPITLIDKNIRCGGIIYTCMFTEDIIVWFINFT